MTRTHLTVLESSASQFPSSSAFKTPILDDNHVLVDWHSVSYADFYEDVLLYSRYWAKVLREDNIPPRSVIGLWIGGYTYQDVLHIYGLSRAGYIPQLFSLRLPNPDVIIELLDRAQASALICDPAFYPASKDTSLPIHVATSVSHNCVLSEPLPDVSVVDRDAIAFVFHTSGSTSGSPKLVPCSFGWLDATLLKSRQVTTPRQVSRQDVSTWMGSMCHIGQTFMLMGSLQHASCVIQPTTISFSSDELVDMVVRCGLNRLNQFAAFLATHLRSSRNDPKLLSILAGLDELLYSGMPLPRGELDWAVQNSINLRNLFGSTECGATLISVGGCGPDAQLLRPLDRVSYLFKPIHEDSEGAHQSTGRVLEFIVRGDSIDCPPASLRHPDGHFHTGDLFQEVTPGHYAFRGRDDDWIKSENSLRCDTKAIEENVRAMCGNLVADCIVVGTGRPSPVLFVESESDLAPERLKKEILRKIRQFHSRRYLHERIVSTSMILVVPRNTLPRTATKGNIRRKAVEDAYQNELDRIYGVIQ